MTSCLHCNLQTRLMSKLLKTSRAASSAVRSYAVYVEILWCTNFHVFCELVLIHENKDVKIWSEKV